MNVKNYIGKDTDLSNEETSRRFTKRHALGLWCAVLPFFGFFAAGYGLKQSNGHIAAELALWACGLTAFFYIALMYRCPRCGEVPSSAKRGTSGVLLFPKRCSQCKAPLLPNHRWGQD
jgi:hypothetical protein